jgi:hypothetical protein
MTSAERNYPMQRPCDWLQRSPDPHYTVCRRSTSHRWLRTRCQRDSCLYSTTRLVQPSWPRPHQKPDSRLHHAGLVPRYLETRCYSHRLKTQWRIQTHCAPISTHQDRRSQLRALKAARIAHHQLCLDAFGPTLSVIHQRHSSRRP